MSGFEITCDGSKFNPCKGLTEEEARAAFEMYTGPQASAGHTFTLAANGVVYDIRTTEKRKK